MKLNYFPLLIICLLAISCKKENIGANMLYSQSNPGAIEDSLKKNADKKEVTKAVRDTNKYYIYFTLDDGPQPPGTKNCKTILEENNIKATFFMVGLHNSGAENQKLVNSLHDDPLFLVSNHSETHAFKNKYKTFYNSPNLSVQDFITAEGKLNIKDKIARLPGRNTWAINNQLKGEPSAFKVAKKLDSLGYSVFGWDVEWDFTHGNIPVESPSQMVRMVEYAFKNGKTFQPKSVVILAHDRMFGKPQYADSLRKFITLMKKNDKYVFDTLDNYPVLTSSGQEKKQ